MTPLPNIDDIAKKIAKQQDIFDPIIEHQYKTNKGDGYVGVVNAIDVRGKNKTLNLIVKSAPKSDKLRGNFPIKESFLHEINFYEKIMPEFNKLQNEYDLKNKFDSVAKCYATVDTVPNELVILENLKSQGYELWDRKKEMNFDHIEFVFRQYGKFHALSYALKEKYPKVFAGLTIEGHNVMPLFVKMAEEVMTKNARDFLTLFDPVKDKDLIDIYGKFANHIMENYMTTTEVDEYAVVVHGDCWCNNMMFKYNEDSTEIPSSMRLLDFQVVMRGSPVLDLAYFFYVCGSEEALNNLPRFQNAYHESLTSHLQQFGLDAERIFPRAAFLTQWKKYSKFGLILAMIILKIMTSDSDETPDFSEFTENNKDANVMQSMNFVSRNHDEFRRRAKNVIKHFYENKFF